MDIIGSSIMHYFSPEAPSAFSGTAEITTEVILESSGLSGYRNNELYGVFTTFTLVLVFFFLVKSGQHGRITDG